MSFLRSLTCTPARWNDSRTQSGSRFARVDTTYMIVVYVDVVSIGTLAVLVVVCEYKIYIDRHIDRQIDSISTYRHH